jgi:hypothetical protein
MNRGHHTANWRTGNELICTACSPECAREQRVNNAKPVVKSMLLLFRLANYSLRWRAKSGRGEQVPFRQIIKIPLDTKLFQAQTSCKETGIPQLVAGFPKIRNRAYE